MISENLANHTSLSHTQGYNKLQILLGIILTKILFDQNTSNSKSDGSIDKYFGPDMPLKILKNIECFTTTLWFITRMVPSALKILKNIENY